MTEAPASRPAVSARADAARIRVLPPELADQIAAGEVVERPASILKELLDNAIDAGATRIDLELGGGGTTRIIVVDDGGGIAAEDLRLSITRHATSKLTGPADLIEPPCLGFRGEALASIAAVAHVTIESRTASADVGTRLVSRPGLPPGAEPCARTVGTRIEIQGLFANVPARRKFLRAASTELSHCLETVARIALVHPQVGFRMRHEGRIVFDVAAGDEDSRVTFVLGRRGAAMLRRFAGSFEGIGVRAWIGDGSGERADIFVVVRRRVVRERAIAQIVREAWAGGSPPCACIIVEPPHGTVDVNVHPQKSEVRFAEVQRVYAAVRRMMASLDLPRVGADVATGGPPPELQAIASAARPPVASAAVSPGASATPNAAATLDAASIAAPQYVLRTRATEADYATARDRLRADADALGQLVAPRTPPPPDIPAAPIEPELLDCLPGPVALMRWEDALLAVDLRVLRTHLLRRRLLAELGGGKVVGQALLVPAVVQLGAADIAVIERARAELDTLGLVVDPFGEDAVVVRTIPAQLRRCVDELDAAAVLARVLPYLRARRRDEIGADEAAGVLAECVPGTVAARFARGFMREAMASGLAIEDIPGVRRWTPSALLEPVR